MVSRILLTLLLVALPVSLSAAPLKARGLSGSGVVLVPENESHHEVILYGEPGIGRLQSVPLSALPVMKAFSGVRGFICLPVMAKKLGWLQVVMDEAERLGWFEAGNGWLFDRWERFLKNRRISLFKGVGKDYYLLRTEPSASADATGVVDSVAQFVVQDVSGDWVRVEGSGSASGWLRWRDQNSRLLVSIDCN